jgi:hypothetical protein
MKYVKNANGIEQIPNSNFWTSIPGNTKVSKN